ncbi:MAG: EAL domain-containing protein [Actinomycetota bacterium]|nr:EAL domain-containing protein [Actinomycetota bacterium]
MTLPGHVPAPRGPAVGVLLLVEDDPDHAFLVRRRLREQFAAELEIVHLSTAAEATRRLAAGDVRCVVLDLSLPDARGLEAVAAVRAADPSVAIVVLTGMNSDELGRQAVQLGAQDYLVKGQHEPDAVGRSVIFALERTKRQAAEQSQAMLAGQLQLVLEASAEGICLLDADGRLSFANRAAADLFGIAADRLVGRALHDFHVCPDPSCTLGERLRTGLQSDAGEQLFRSRDGATCVLEVRVRPLHTGGGSVVNLSDVTARRHAQDALAEREAQLVDAQRLAHLGSWEWDVTTDEVHWSAEMFRVTGLIPGEVPLDGGAFGTYAALVPEGERAELRMLFDSWTTARAPVAVVHQLVRPDGQTRWLQCRASVSDLPGHPLRVVGTVQDITEQKAAEDALAHQALHDTLTGLPNRALLLDRLNRALADSRRAAVAVVFMDLDRFKWVNDSLSHAAGDELLIAVARRLSGLLRPADTLARLGGDEFVLVCEQLDTEERVFGIIDRLTRELERPFPIEGRELVVTASMGLALAAPGDQVDSESLIRDADTAMYRAKENGRARCEIFDEAMRQRASERLEVQHDLRLALQRSEIKAFYQPIVSLCTGQVVGCEALARWEHPERGLLLPVSFIPHAEETGAIVALGAAVLRDACLQVAQWNRSRPSGQELSVSVNVSARQLVSDLLIDTVRDALAVSGLPPGLLCLEVTESVVMEDVAVSGMVLGQLRDLGIRTAVDDFGTGYSSLAYLLSLPVDVLKVDRSFVAVLDVADGPAVAIVRAIAALAEALGLGVLAEGVETMEQLAQLGVLGVQQGQGFLWGRAVPAAQAAWATWPPTDGAVPTARPAPAHVELGRTR